MAIRNFITERRLVTANGRRFVCGPPTLGAVVRFLALFAPEIMSAWKVSRETDEEVASEVWIDLFLEGDQDRVAEVLTCCVDLLDGDTFQAFALIAEDRKLAKKLTIQILDLCDPARIFRSFNVGAVAPPTVSASPHEPNFTMQEIVIVKMCASFGVLPAQVESMPYEQFLDTGEILGLLEDTESDDPKTRGNVSRRLAWMDGTEIPGIVMTKRAADA